MRYRLIYVFLLVAFAAVFSIFVWHSGKKSGDPNQASALPGMDKASSRPAALAEAPPTLKSTVQTDPPKAPEVVFVVPADPKLQELRLSVLKPVREIKDWSDVMAQGDAMAELEKLRKPEAAAVLAELLFAEKASFYKIERINGKRQSSFSYQVMTYLYKMLRNSPEPLNGELYGDDDIPIWRTWWALNHNKLSIRNIQDPVPLPSGMRSR
jgi:hypothetical protein